MPFLAGGFELTRGTIPIEDEAKKGLGGNRVPLGKFRNSTS